MASYPATAPDSREPFLQRFFLDRKWRWARHLVCLSLFAFFVLRSKNDEYSPVGMAIMKLVLFAWLVLLPYLNMYWLVPRFLFRRKYFSYLFLVLGTSLATFYLVFEGGKRLIAPYRIVPGREEDISLESLFSFLFAFSVLMAASTCIKLLQRWLKDSYRLRELEKTRLNSELDQLKSQINPHFLFNMLNNTHVLIHRNPALAAEVVLKLSDLLRYQLYDCARNQVLLGADIRFLDDFLHLEKIRRDFFSFSIVKEGIPDDMTVPPFLFIAFVENAIKHSTDMEQESYVHLQFMVQQAQLTFHCTNSRPASPLTRKEQPGGLGLANVQRRLELLYPGKHSLRISEEEKTYRIILTLPV